MSQPTSSPEMAVSRLRLLGYSVVLTALAFSQSTGLIVPDTKFDLVAAPWKFLMASTNLWDPGQAFGQIRFQAYGYLWPMGPFFGVGELLALPEWAIQRLWWAFLLNVGFFGVLCVLRAMKVGSGWSQVAGAASFVLALRVTTLLGANSVELWPTAVAPWVLLALIKGSQSGSVLKWGAVAGLLVACAGGVNATAASAVLPMGVVWILTRAAGPRRWRLLGWWTLFTTLACLWWLVPLLIFGRYSPPILGYMENSAVTQSFTDLTNTMLGTSNWVPYLSGSAYPAGQTVLGTPFVLLDAAAVAALGILGICLLGAHRRFVVWTLLVGVALVGFGWDGWLSGVAGQERQGLLDGALAALRNTHKYDGSIRLALAVGVAHALSMGVKSISPETAKRARAVVAAATAVVLCGMAFPWLTNKVASPGGFEVAPSYWQDVVDYLAADGNEGTALVAPAASFGDYVWGSTHDDVIQPIAESPWATRNVLPLATPGNVELLDRITSMLEGGRPSPEMVQMLREAGVGQLVIRNDLDRWVTGAPDPAYVHATLDGTPGLVKVAGFGPMVGLEQVTDSSVGRVVALSSLSGRYESVEIYTVLGADDSASLVPLGQTLIGAPGDALLAMAADVDPSEVRRLVLTDSNRRQETAFHGVRANRSATSPAGSAARLHGSESFHRYVDDQERWQTTLAWQGIAAADASASQADADQALPLNPGTSAAAALDQDRSTAWRSPALGAPDGQWIQVFFTEARSVDRVSIRVARGSVPVDALRISAGDTTTQVTAPAPGTRVSYPLGASDAESITVTAVGGPSIGSFGIAELSVPGVEPTRFLRLPAAPASALVDEIELHREQERSACPVIGDAVACQAALITTAEDGDELNRIVTLSTTAKYEIQGVASLRRSRSSSREILADHGLRIRTSGAGFQDIAGSRLALADGDPGTTWQTNVKRPTIRLTFDEPRVIRQVQLVVGEAAAVSVPTKVRLSDGRNPDGPSTVGTLDAYGRISVPYWNTDQLVITVLDFEESFDESGFPLRTGVSDLLVNGSPLITSPLVQECGSGPTLTINGQVFPSRVRTTLSAAMRGRQATFDLCGTQSVDLLEGESVISVEPSSTFRVDRLSLVREGSTSEPSAAVAVQRTADGSPVSAEIAESDRDRILSLPQNVNDGWTATVAGVSLEPTQVAGWQQAWVVPAGTSGTVSFDYPPGHRFTVALWVGALGALIVLAVVSWPRRHRGGMPALEPGGSTAVDLLLVVASLAWLGGWIGLALGAAAIVVWRIAPFTRELPQVAAAAFGLAAAVRIWPQEPLPEWTSQALALAAVALVAGSVLENQPTFLSRRKGRSRTR